MNLPDFDGCPLEHQRIRNLIEHHQVGHLDFYELFTFAQELQSVDPEVDPTAAQRALSILEIHRHALMHSARTFTSINEDWDTMCVPDLPGGPDSGPFPMEVFLDYSEPMPEFNIGDLVWVRSDVPHLSPDGAPCYRAVVVVRTLDLEDFYYVVAPFEEGMEMCNPQPFEIAEEDIAYDRETFDPMRNRLQVVKG